MRQNPTTTKANAPGKGARTSSRQHYPIVAVGASAGGLESLETFFRHVPPGSGMAFIVVTHLSPHHPTHLPELLQKYSSMPVRVARDGARVVPDEIFLLPPDASLTIEEEHLKVAPLPEGRQGALPIDTLLTSLADDAAECAYAVILSGMGSDGTAGAKAVKQSGGLVAVQSPESAAFGGMPESVIMAGAADLVLPSDELPRALLRYTASWSPLDEKDRASLQQRIAEALPQISTLILERTGNDISGYKPNTLIRRIERRMLVHGLNRLPDYLELLRGDPEETSGLFNDFLINVTGFFRDGEAFDALREKILLPLLRDRLPRDPLRIWVPGCSTGEEAYSLAILVREFAEEAGNPVPVQIFATDIDHSSISKARAGTFAAAQMEGLSPGRLQRFFHRVNGHYRVSDELREPIVFAEHNLLRDPPFSRLDLISCRNLLIYLDQRTQGRLLPLFHHALKPDGILFLGSSETVAKRHDLFEAIEGKWKIFRRRPSPGVAREFILQGKGQSGRAVLPPSSVPRRLGTVPLGERLLMQRYAPPSVIVNARFELVHAFGRTAPFLEPPVGEPALNVMKMARRELRPVLRAAVYQALADGRGCCYQGIKVGEAGDERLINLVVETLDGVSDQVLVIFEDAAGIEPLDRAVMSCGDMVRQLEEQLRATTDQLYANAEDWERSDEALKASNEELMSMNEELQSANEELEMSKEELQALNEELATVNAELQQRLEELAEANNDLQNLTHSTRIATIFLDKDLRIKLFTPAAADLFNLISGDLGRPLRHISGNLEYPDMEVDARQVLKDLQPVDREVSGAGGRACFLVRVLPYRTLTDVIEGVVFTFTDISARKEAETALEEQRRLAEARVIEAQEKQRLLDALMEHIPIGITVADAPDVTIRTVSRFGRELSGRDATEIEGIPVPEHSRKWGVYHLDGVTPTSDEELPLTRATLKGEVVRDEEWLLRRPDGKEIVILCHAGPIRDANGSITGGLIAWQDISARKEAEHDLRRAREVAEEATRAKSEFLSNMSHEIRTPMTVILGSLEHLARTCVEPDQLQLLEMAQNAGARMLNLVNDILDLSRVESGHVELSAELFDLRGCVEKSVRLFELQAQEKGISLLLDLSPALPPLVHGDSSRLGQILVNLIGNAVKFTDKGEVWVTVAPADDPGRMVFRVRDTGIGIPKDKQPLLFQNFSQLDPARTRKYGGSGLGLVITRGLVELLGGTISVESAEGKGSLFSFVLPLPEVQAPVEKKRQEEASPHPELPLRILLVEDDPMVLEMVRMMLQRQPWTVVAARNGCEGVQRWERGDFDLILMDVQMPEMDGFEATRAIREREVERGGHIPILALSAFGGKEAEEQCRRAGMDGLLSKPVGMEELYSAIKRAALPPLLKGGAW